MTIDRAELPVSEAPKDGRRVLLRAGPLYMAAVWSEKTQTWLEPEGKCQIEREPTHYLPPSVPARAHQPPPADALAMQERNEGL